MLTSIAIAAGITAVGAAAIWLSAATLDWLDRYDLEWALPAFFAFIMLIGVVHAIRLNETERAAVRPPAEATR